MFVRLNRVEQFTEERRELGYQVSDGIVDSRVKLGALENEARGVAAPEINPLLMLGGICKALAFSRCVPSNTSVHACIGACTLYRSGDQISVPLCPKNICMEPQSGMLRDGMLIGNGGLMT